MIGVEKRTSVKCNCPITACAMMCAVQLLRHNAYTVLLVLKSWLLIANLIREFCYSYDDKNNGVVN